MVVQHRRRPDAATYIGAGKVEELKRLREETSATIAIFDDELSPTQQRNLEKALGIKVIDRTALILDIFASRARTREGRLQVDLAQTEYLLPRLAGQWSHLERLGGGIGTRGPGETQIETDRRLARERIAHLKRELEEVRRHRQLYRENRRKHGLPVVAIVGYTNAGKSTLLNTLTGAGVLAEDKLFATLDPTTRQVTLPGQQVVLFSDTVGFIQKLPATLVAAFRATLEELQEADVLVHIVDISHPNAVEHQASVEHVLRELGVAAKPTVLALNKVDRLFPDAGEGAVRLAEREYGGPNVVAIAAAPGWGMERLLAAVQSAIVGSWQRISVTIPYGNEAVVARVRQRGHVDREEYTEGGICIEARVPLDLAGALAPFSP
ncbi:MAG: GTPase HflX [Dehalococcoidia bacterium]|nr:MAG: GTPase HflX [Dehalococcoidia bacterium]